MKKRKDSKQRASVAKRTLYYYWQCSKKYKWYAIGTIISTPIVVLIRTVLIPLIFANMIDAIAGGISNRPSSFAAGARLTRSLCCWWCNFGLATRLLVLEI